MSISGTSVSEGNSSTTNLPFTVTLTNPVDVAVTVQFSTADGTAVASGDYAAQTAVVVTIPANTLSVSHNVLVNGDTLIEANETLTGSIANLDNSGRSVSLSATTSAVGTIINDDSATLSGRGFDDLNGNGTGDPGLAGITIQLVLDANNNGLNDDAVTDTQVTAVSTGAYSFNITVAGRYFVQQVLPANRSPSVPVSPNYFTLLVTNSAALGGNDFGSFIPVAIHGQKFADVNDNAQQDSDEPGLDGFIIKLLDSQGMVVQQQTTMSMDVDMNGSTDPLTEAGLYWFQNVRPGTYTIVEQPLTGWRQTFPVSGSYQITLTSGQAPLTGLNFGNFKESAEIHGQKFEDLNGNGGHDSSIIKGSQPDVVFVIDVSGSTRDPFRGTAVGDLNGDGRQNTILDAEIAGLIALNNRLVSLGFGNTSNVSIVSFSTTAQIRDMNAVIAGVQFSTNPLTDANANSRRDVDDVLRTLIDGGTTNFADALAKARQIIVSQGTTPDNANVIFLSDGFPTTGGAYNTQVAQLRAVANNVRAFGVGNGASLTSLQVIDANASIITTTDQLLSVFSGTGTTVSFFEPGLNGWTIELVDQTVGSPTFGQVVATQITHDIDLNGDGMIDINSERGRYIFKDLPAGNFVVRERLDLQPGWIQTFPAAPGTYQLDLALGDVATDIDFGNFQLGAIHGQKFNDANGNGQRDSGEAGLNGWMIELRDSQGTVVATQQTMDMDLNNDQTIDPITERGLYWFTGLTAGTYAVHLHRHAHRQHRRGHGQLHGHRQRHEPSQRL